MHSKHKAQMVLGPCRCVGCGQHVGYKRLYDGSLMLVAARNGNQHICRHSRQEEAFPSLSSGYDTRNI